MKIAIAGWIGLTLSCACLAQNFDLPTIKSGDSWIYRNTVEKGSGGWNQTEEEITVARVTTSSIYCEVKPAGSAQAPTELIMGADWARLRAVNGTETVVNKPLSFPLSPGKTWEVQYTEQQPNKAHKFEKWDSKFTVVGYEMVEVPAGKFNALKVESEGTWNAELNPIQAVVQSAQVSQGNTTMVTQAQKTTDRPISGRTYKAFWYVPETKRWVKSVEEYYSTGGVRTERYTQELSSFKPARQTN